METTILRTESGSVVCDRCAIADTFLTRLRGLLGRRELDPREGILLRPGGAVHTMFMRFAIDVVFLDAELRVVKVVPSLRPWRAARAQGGRAVVELAAGAASVSVGERLVLGD